MFKKNRYKIWYVYCWICKHYYPESMSFKEHIRSDDHNANMNKLPDYYRCDYCFKFHNGDEHNCYGPNLRGYMNPTFYYLPIEKNSYYKDDFLKNIFL